MADDDRTTLEEAAADLRETAAGCWEEKNAADADADADYFADYFADLAEAAQETGFTEEQLTGEIARQTDADAAGAEADDDTGSVDDADDFDAVDETDAVIESDQADEPPEDEAAEVLGGQIMTLEQDIKDAAFAGKPELVPALSQQLDELTTKRAVSSVAALMKQQEQR